MNQEYFPLWLHSTTLLGIPLGNMLIAVVVAAAMYLIMQFSLRVTLKRLSILAGKTNTRIDDVLVELLSKTSRLLLTLVALLVGVSMLDLPERWAGRVSHLWFLALALQMAMWANRAISIGLRGHADRRAAPGVATQVSAAATLMSWGLRILLWAMVSLAMLSNLGVNITAFIASLGVGGIAVALAAQSVLGDLFASVAIAVDKPFEVGDSIAFGSVAGTVESVGIKTTRIRSRGGEQIVISNTELLKQTVSNYKRLQARRIVFGFGVTYGTTPQQAEAISGIVKKIVECSDQLRFDRAHLKAFGDSSLDYEVVYTVLDSDYNVYMHEQQRINLELMKELAKQGIEFAFPTRTLYMARDASRNDSERSPAGVPA